MLRIPTRHLQTRAFSTQPHVVDLVNKLNSAAEPDSVKDAVKEVKALYPDANVAFRKPTAKRPAPEPLAPGLIQQYKLNEPSRYVPLVSTGFLFMTGTGILQLNEEWMLGCVFAVYSGIVYSKLRGPAMAMLEANHKAFLETFEKAENTKIKALEESEKKEVEKSLLLEEIKFLPEAKQAQKELQAFNEVEAAKAELRNKVARSLEAVALLQERVSQEASRDLVHAAHASVLESLSSEASKKKSFEAAMASLKNPKQAPKSSPVLDLFTEYFKKTAKANAGKAAPIHPDVKAKMNEVLSSLGLKATDDSMTKFVKA